jgi:hypothetical protein
MKPSNEQTAAAFVDPHARNSWSKINTDSDVLWFPSVVAESFEDLLMPLLYSLRFPTRLPLQAYLKP